MFSPADFSDLWKLPICTDSALCDILTKKGKEQKPMHEYEVLIETINPCGGEAHSKKEFLDIEAESPEALANTLEELARNASLRKIMGARGRAVAEREFDQRTSYLAIVNLLRNLL